MIVKLIVDGGNMKPGPTVSQQLGPMGINLGKVIEEVNKTTSGFKGMKVPVEIEINTKTKEFTITVFSPPVSELIKTELKVEKGSGLPGTTKIGNLAIEQIITIAKTKMPDMLARDLKKAVKLVIGSCVSLGVLIEDKEAKEIIVDVESGMYDAEIKEERTEVSQEKKTRLEKTFSEIEAKQEAAAKELEEAKAAEEAEKLEETEQKPEEAKEEETEEKEQPQEKTNK
ncbi:MAG: 50S ribosomal protein L11 [Nanoarchaeota archaeon]|nr:50S ribosomal protein L11 [Nanoarchaeota archaeon]